MSGPAEIADILAKLVEKSDTEAKGMTALETVLNPSDLPGTLARLQASVPPQPPSYSIRLRSTGNRPNVALTRIVFQTLFVSASKPVLLTFDQFILTAFTGPGQFDLVECDVDNSNPVTIADKSGYTAGVTTGPHSTLTKINTVDKIYKVVFVPGTTGDGIFSIRPQELPILIQSRP